MSNYVWCDIENIAWKDFIKGEWNTKINVRDFIQLNYTPYHGDDIFLAPPTQSTLNVWNKVFELLKKERESGGVLDIDTETISTIISHNPGYILKEDEKIVGLQTDKPLKRAVMPFGGIRMIVKGCQEYGKEINMDIENFFTNYRKTHNSGVYDIYTSEMKKVKKAGIITGLPDAYGRGRIIGDYRRLPLYGVDFLIKDKQTSLESKFLTFDSKGIQDREEIQEQIKALKQLKEMAASYGYDISNPAQNSQQALQWLYFAYLAAVKEQNGAAMSLGRVSTFLDIYFERDLKNGTMDEAKIQELVDHFIIKLRIVRFLRTREYDKLFSGDPTWITESIGGMGIDKRTLVTKTSFRILHTLENLGPAPEPNMTVLWSLDLPRKFKEYCTKLSINTSSIQYENDDLMRQYWGDDYAIACCVSAMKIGKQMQFFGARCNIAKALLYAINGGKDEISGEQIAPFTQGIDSEYLEFEEVIEKFDKMLDWVAKIYIDTLNTIHYMHDKYCYEKLQMAFHDSEVYRTMACGIAGLSVVADSLSAIKHSKVRIIRNETGLAVDYEIFGEYPKFGNNENDVDIIAKNIVEQFINKLSKQAVYRGAQATLSILTITSNVVYGEKTGNTPDGRKSGEPFAPGANPMHGRDKKGALAVLNSVSKLPYHYSKDGISYTFSIAPNALGKEYEWKVKNLVGLLDGFFKKNGHHINVNVFNKETLIDAMENPEKYPQLTIRVSGYAVNFIKLTKKQQLDVIERTIHQHF